MGYKEIKASDVRSGDVVIFNGGVQGKQVMGEVDRHYQMVENRVQFRFLPGGMLSAITVGRDDLMKIAA